MSLEDMKITLQIRDIVFICLLITGAMGAVGAVGTYAGDMRYVTIASTEKAQLRSLRLREIDLAYLERVGKLTERERLQLEQLRIDIKELEADLN